MDLVKAYGLDQTTWTYKGFHGVLHTFFPLAECVGRTQDILGQAVRIALYFASDDYMHWYWHDKDLETLREAFFARLRKDPGYLARLEEEWQGKLDVFDDLIRDIDDTDLSTLSNDELHALYVRFNDAYTDEFRYFMSLGDAISMHAHRYLVPDFQNTLGDDFDRVFPDLLQTSHLSFIEQEQNDRARLARMQDEGTLKREDLEAHARKYFYIENNYAIGKRLTAEDFSHRLDDAKERDRKTQQDISGNYEFTPWQKTLLHVIDQFFMIQDTRKKYVLISTTYQFDFLKEAVHRGGIPFHLLQYSILPEYPRALAGSLDQEMLGERKRFSMCIHTRDRHEIITGKEARKTFDHFNPPSDAIEVKGMIASTGNASGRIRIIFKSSDLAGVREGDVIATSMTRPEMVPALKKACAIITDEGGITSHAAIISRELAIPCIIGTGNATKAFNDGDMVEVDAERGIVRKVHNKPCSATTRKGD